MIDKDNLYKQYLFLRRDCKKGFSAAVLQLSVSNNVHEQVIIKLLIEAEEGVNA